jgi:N-acetylglucosamine-6-phosphate deacetylase
VAGGLPLGVHAEGPFLATERRGAHRTEHLRAPSRAALAGWTRAAGVAVATLAPEQPGGLEAVEALAGAGVVVSLGHSRATAAEARAAVDAGASWVTHLFNAMAPLHHREPGLVGVALDDGRLRVGAIADGVHVDPLVLRLIQRLLGPRLTLVTDAVAALGRDPGGEAGGASRTPSGVLAGSTTPMDAAVRNLVRHTGADPATAVAAASAAPAAVLGDRQRGTLAAGARADLAVLGPDLDVRATWVGGVVVYRVEGGLPC